MRSCGAPLYLFRNQLINITSAQLEVGKKTRESEKLIKSKIWKMERDGKEKKIIGFAKKVVILFSRVLRDSIINFSVGPLVRWSQKGFRVFFCFFFMSLNSRKETWRSKLLFQMTFWKKKFFVCLSAWLFLKVPTHAT